MNPKKLPWLLLFVLGLVGSSLAGPCVRIQDASMADIHINTCGDASRVQYWFTENYMAVSASLQSCQNADEAGMATSSIYFNRPHYMEELYPHTFEYTIMATDVDAHCVVSLISGEPKNLTDQNGLSNDPLEDLSEYALNQWYTRKFRLDNGTLGLFDRFLRVGLTCAASTPVANNFTTQTVLIRDIRFTSNSFYKSKVIYNYQLCAAGCELNSVSGAQCMPKEDGSAAWTYPNDLVNPIVKTAAPLTVLGDVQTSNLWIASSLNATKCLKAMGSNGVTVHLSPNQNITIYHQVGCMLPRLNFAIDINTEYSGVPMSSSYPTNCVHQLHPENVVVTMDLDRVSFFAGSDTVNEICRNEVMDPVVKPSQMNYAIGIILPVVLSVVGAVAIFLGVFFGIRKYQRLRQKKSLTGVEVPMA